MNEDLVISQLEGVFPLSAILSNPFTRQSRLARLKRICIFPQEQREEQWNTGPPRTSDELASN